MFRRRTLQLTLLPDEWKSSKGGLSTMNRELAIQLAKHPNVDVTFFVSKCTEADKEAARSHNVTIAEAQEWPGFESIDCLCFPPKDLVIDIIVGHGVKLGKQAQAIKYYRHCAWVQVVHTAPEELAMFKAYSGAISKGDEKQWTEVNLCKKAELVVAVGPKLHEFYSAYLSASGKHVFKLTPGIFSELYTLKLSTQGAKKFRVLVFGRGDTEDFELKGFDIAAKAIAELNDRSYHLVFVGAPSGNEKQVAEKLLEQGLNRSQLTVKGYIENRDDLATLLSTANLAIMPSRTEGFGLTALEALSAGLPLLVSQNSGFGEALQEIPFSSSWIVDSEDPAQWAEAIKVMREKGREKALQECEELRTRYSEKYSWEKQCNDLVEMMENFVDVSSSEGTPDALIAPSQNRSQTDKSKKNVEEEKLVTTMSMKCDWSKPPHSTKSRPEKLIEAVKGESDVNAIRFRGPQKREGVDQMYPSSPFNTSGSNSQMTVRKSEPVAREVANNTEVERETYNITNAETLLMKNRLRYGQISYCKHDEQEVEDNGEINREPLEMPITQEKGAENKRDDDPGMSNDESQPYSLVDFEVVEKPEADETLLMKTRLLYGQISYSKDDLVVWKEQWSPHDELREDIANKFKNVAVADLEIYSEEETGKIHVIITKAADDSVIYAIIEIVHNNITWIVDNVRYYIQWAVGSQPEQK